MQNIKKFLKKSVYFLIDLIFPYYSYNNYSIGNNCCNFKVLPIHKGFYSNSLLGSVYCLGPYKEKNKELIRDIKIHRSFAKVKNITESIYPSLVKELKNEVYFITWPAFDMSRYNSRGFFLPKLLVEEIVKLNHKELGEIQSYLDLFARKIDTPVFISVNTVSSDLNLIKKSKLNKQERFFYKHNFEISQEFKYLMQNISKLGNYNENLNLIIFDDICTTGSTILENLKVIKNNYPKIKIYPISLAFAG